MSSQRSYRGLLLPRCFGAKGFRVYSLELTVQVPGLGLAVLCSVAVHGLGCSVQGVCGSGSKVAPLAKLGHGTDRAGRRPHVQDLIFAQLCFPTATLRAVREATALKSQSLHPKPQKNPKP